MSDKPRLVKGTCNHCGKATPPDSHFCNWQCYQSYSSKDSRKIELEKRAGK